MAAQDNLFQEINTSHFGDNLRKRTIFLPKLLEEKTKVNMILFDNEQFRNAHKTFCKWADIESSDKIKQRTESNLEGEFFKEIFGDALGYKLFSENSDQWDAEQKYNVNSGQADAVIGNFSPSSKMVQAVIELKGPTTNVDRDKTNGRTLVQQCWDYLNILTECPWGVVCNFVSFRLYHRNSGSRTYELFTLQQLRHIDNLKKFYYIFQRDGLLTTKLQQIPRAEILLQKSYTKEKEVGDSLYSHYHLNRLNLIHYLKTKHDKTLDKAIYIAQKLIDRVIFIAFCEDRGLLPPASLKRAWEQIRPFAKVTNPRWQNFKELFISIDKGNSNADIAPYNGGLFRKDEEIDNLDLDDQKTDFFRNIGDYDFCNEINVEVLGHIFERSVNDIERIRTGGLFAEHIEPEKQVKMSKSAERKKFGIYYTPKDFTEFVTHNTIYKLAVSRFDSLADSMGIQRENAETAENDKNAKDYWSKCLDLLKHIKIVDPACGNGAFLIQAYDTLEELYLDILYHLSYQGVDVDTLKGQIPDIILTSNIYGVDLYREAVEITQLSLWLRSAVKGRSLADLSKNIVCGNSLVDDPNVHPDALNWQKTFPEVFSRENGGFDCVIGNPPWERMKLQEREFFDGRDMKIATANNAAKRRELIKNIEKRNPELFVLYRNALKQTESSLEHIRHSDRYPLTGKGDINTYAIFAELAYSIIGLDGMVGLLVPSGIATDKTTKDFFGTLIDEKRLIGLYDFENRKKIFIDVDGRFKFSILLFSGINLKNEKIDFCFFAHKIHDLKNKNRSISLTPSDIKMLNPNTKTCPVFRNSRDAEITKSVYRRIPVLIDKNRKEGGNPWGLKFFTMFHQTNDAELFHTEQQLKAAKCKRQGTLWKKGEKIFLPLYEAKMIQMYDHRAASVIINEENWFRQGQTDATSEASHQNPEYYIEPRRWTHAENIQKALNNYPHPMFLAYKNVTSPTNQRTMIAAFIPNYGVINSAPLILFDESLSARHQSCFLANLNSFAYDYIMRQKIGNVNLNYFLLEQIPMFSPDFYDDPCPWDKKQSLKLWISQRVLKLTCTSNDMIGLAKAANFKKGIHKWKASERLKLTAELDAAYFLLYGIEKNDVLYILSTFSGIAKQTESIFENSIAKAILENYNTLSSNM